MEKIQTIDEAKQVINDMFGDLIKRQMLQFNYDGRTGWLEVNYDMPLNYSPRRELGGYRWAFLCAQNVFEETPKSLQNRILLLMCDALRNKAQDINGIMDENILTKKPII